MPPSPPSSSPSPSRESGALDTVHRRPRLYTDHVTAFSSDSSTTGHGGKRLSVEWNDDGKSPSRRDWGRVNIYLATGSRDVQYKLQTLDNQRLVRPGPGQILDRRQRRPQRRLLLPPLRGHQHQRSRRHPAHGLLRPLHPRPDVRQLQLHHHVAGLGRLRYRSAHRCRCHRFGHRIIGPLVLLLHLHQERRCHLLHSLRRFRTGNQHQVVVGCCTQRQQQARRLRQRACRPCCCRCRFPLDALSSSVRPAPSRSGSASQAGSACPLHLVAFAFHGSTVRLFHPPLRPSYEGALDLPHCWEKAAPSCTLFVYHLCLSVHNAFGRHHTRLQLASFSVSL
ncbi:hypothetical protein L1887_57005 [Cichorium endivia]|nr:hypothetical protein L1887_57005 [Cichorium endivia]